MAPAYAGLCRGVGRGRGRVDRRPNHADDTSQSGDRLASLCPGSRTDTWVALRARRPRAGLPVLSEAPGPGDTRLPDLRADDGGPVSAGALSMTLALGYAMSTLIFLGFFALTLAPQVASKRYHAFLYWAVVVATTTVGTTMSDYLDRTLQLGYVASSILLFGGVLAVLFVWHR